ncbi:MAG TPA: carboxypeptidase regulatory-like domain-containing protein [Gemmatimonadales bacterium]|nr:carboxypeptidase regulatory-like domain-containing protein [Gemmatimonadales bacterium]
MRQLALLLGLAPAVAGAQISGTVYDSLLGTPLRGADVWVRGSQQRGQTDSSGRFELDSIAPGRYTLLVSHPGLDSAGLFTLAVPVTVTGTHLPVSVATPSLATLWRRRCGQELMERADSGLVFGVIQDAATQAHLAGAGVLLQWLRIIKTDSVTVQTQPREVAVRTDSTGTYYACGVARTMKIALRAYAQRDSSGLIDLMPGARGIARQDLMVALSPAAATGRPAAAVLRGQAMTPEQTPVWGGRVTVREGGTTMIDADGAFTLRNVAPGTQWVTVQAIGRAPFGEAVDLRPGDTVFLPVTLGPVPVTLAPVRVEGHQSRMLHDFEERRRLGAALGYFRGEDDLKDLASLRSVFTTLPSIRLVRGSGNTDFIAVLPAPGAGGRGWCVPALYVDGFLSDWDQLFVYQPKDLVGVELYPRPASAPAEYQQVATGCGVVLIWTKYLK